MLSDFTLSFNFATSARTKTSVAPQRKTITAYYEIKLLFVRNMVIKGNPQELSST